MRTHPAPRRSVATASVALAVFTAGLTLAFVQAWPAHAAASGGLVPADSSSGTAQVSTDIPRVHPLWAPERNAAHPA